MKRRQNRRLGGLVFVLPVMVVAGLFMVGLFVTAGTSTGVLVVEARSVYGSKSIPLTATATVGGTTLTTPFNLTLVPGLYTVAYSQLPWLHTADSRTIQVVGGRTVYAVGVYSPIVDVIGVTDAGFNATSVRAEHVITPVIWVNTGTNAVVLQSSLFSVTLNPGGNYTRFFTTGGTVTVTVLGTTHAMTVYIA